MMKLLLNLPLRTLIPGILIVLSTLIGMVVTLDRLQREEEDIVSASQTNLVELLGQVQEGVSDRMLHGDLTAANLRLSSAALARNVNELHLVDERDTVLLSTRYALRGLPASQAIQHYRAADAAESELHQRVIVRINPDQRDIHGYFPIALGQERGELRPSRYGVLFVDYDLSNALAQARSHALRQSLILFGAFTLLTLLLMAFFHWRVTRRVASLAGTVSRFAQGDLTQRASLAGGDELAYLASSFNDMAVHLQSKNHQLEAEAEERRLAELALRDSRQMLLLVLDSIPVGVFWKDKELNYLGCNRRFARDAGLPSMETVVGMREADLVWKRLAERYEADDLQVITSGEAILHREESTLMPNGETIWLQISKVPLRDDGGRVTGLLGTYQDITARKKSEEALRKSSEELEDLYERAPCGYHSLGADGTFLRINQTELRWLGYTREEMVGKMKFSEIITSASLGVFQEHYPRFKETGSVHDLEFEMIRKDGTLLPVLLSATAIYGAGHQYVMSRSTVYDITDRKRFEEVSRAASFYARSLIEASLDPLVTISAEGKIMDVNCATEAVTGIHREQLVGSDFTDYFTEPDKARAGYRQVFAQGYVTDYPLAIRHASGSVTEVLYNAALYRNEHGEVAGVFAAARDITELKHTEEALKNLNETLEQRVRDELAKNREKDHLLIQQSRLAAMGEMVHNIAHQWRQPLNVLGLVVNEIKDDYQHGELTDERLQQSVASAQRLLQKMSVTIDDFRNFFRPDKEKQNFDIAKVVRDTASLMEASLKNNAIELEMELEEPVEVEGYPSQYSQALLNIIVNAKEAIQQRKGISRHIRVWLRKLDGKAVLSVEDNGGGIPAEIMPHLFDPYFTTKEQGSGIGLYMTKMIIENSMGGQVRAENVGNGARFDLLVKLAADSSVRGASRKPRARGLGGVG